MRVTKKLTLKQIQVDLALNEVQLLEKYCQQTGKSQIDVIQELIRSLPD